MTSKKVLLLLILITCFSDFGITQDIHFTQFYASPLHLNSANTGNYKGDWRIINNYRNQWSSVDGIPFETFLLAYDQQFFIDRHKLSGGLMIKSDASGPNELVGTRIYGSVAYEMSVNDHIINVGLQPGYIKKTINTQNAIFPDSWNHPEGDFSGGGVEQLPVDQTSNFDLNIGVTWHKKMGNLTPFGGIAVQHLLSPGESFFDADSADLTLRQIYHGGVKYRLNDKVVIWPHIFYSYQNYASELQIGSNASYYISPNDYKILGFFGGVMYRDGFIRNLDALAVIGGVHIKNLDIGVSYDLNISELQPATKFRGGFEISIIYTAPSTLLEKITIPCERL